jgi:hypothetical protein
VNISPPSSGSNNKQITKAAGASGKLSSELHGITARKTIVIKFVAVRTPNPTSYYSTQQSIDTEVALPER